MLPHDVYHPAFNERLRQRRHQGRAGPALQLVGAAALDAVTRTVAPRCAGEGDWLGPLAHRSPSSIRTLGPNATWQVRRRAGGQGRG